MTTRGSYSVKLYSCSLQEMIRAGRYDWVNSDINEENFPSEREAELTLVHLNREVSTEEVLEVMEKMGLQPATLVELLAFGVQYPEIQHEFPIAALGSNWVNPGGLRYVPYISGEAGRRRLHIYWDAYEWLEEWRFLALPKEAP